MVFFIFNLILMFSLSGVLYLMVRALPRIADVSHAEGLFTESLIAGIAQSEPEAKKRMNDFLAGKAKKVGK